LKKAILAAAAMLAILAGCGDPDPTGDRVVVGFAQTGAESGWRTAHTESMKSEAARRGVELKFADGQAKQEKQIQALRSFIAQQVDVIILSPLVETGWEPVLREAKRAEIPVILLDRRIAVDDDSLYTCFIGSDFVEEGRLAARWLVEKVSGPTRIAELQGTPGSAPAIDRRRGFLEVLEQHPELEIIDSQSGDFRRSKGKEVMEAFLKKHGRQIDVLFAHNDDMAIGAIQAIEEAGLRPGEDLIIVSIDAIRPAFEAMIAGTLNCSVECNPIQGPAAFDAVERILAGETLPKRTYIQDEVFDRSVAAEVIDTRQY